MILGPLVPWIFHVFVPVVDISFVTTAEAFIAVADTIVGVADPSD